MTKPMKKPEFLSPFARLYTRPDLDAYNAIAFRACESFGDEDAPALASPLTWSDEAVGLMAAGAASPAIPAELRAVEENTVPSWLWRHRSVGKSRASEGDLRYVIDRAAGSAAAKAWKLGLFSNEKNARTFYDEARYGLMQRHIAIVPEVMASWGLDWAYGIDVVAHSSTAEDKSGEMLSNAAIDTLIGKNSLASSKIWKKLFTVRGKDFSHVTLRLTDIAADWHSGTPNAARAAIDLMSLRHNDGSLNIDALRQAARLLIVLLDLQERRDVTIGLANLAPLLLALGLAYDSDAGRAMAASVTALVTAECIATSAEMAALRGPSTDYAFAPESIMRSLRNHRRAAYGDASDYEKLSVLPASLPLKNCPDLALTAEAQRRWDDALAMTRAFGLRAVQVTDLTSSAVLALMMNSASQGLEPLQKLTQLQSDETGGYVQTVVPAVGEALVRLDYPRASIQTAMLHISGTHSLRRAPAISYTSLQAHGLSEAVLEKIESYLPCVNSVRLAVTPWIVGIDFCRTHLKIPVRTLQSQHFDLLHHLGFSDADVAIANSYCYGFGTARSAKILHLRHRPLFASGNEISAEARIRMAASVQSFVTGDTGLAVSLPLQQTVERGAEMTLSAWRRGLKALTIIFDPTLTAAPVRKSAIARRIKPTPESHAKPFTSPPRRTSDGKTAPVMVTKKAHSSHRSTPKH
jgi:hypothetical protein